MKEGRTYLVLTIAMDQLVVEASFFGAITKTIFHSVIDGNPAWMAFSRHLVILHILEDHDSLSLFDIKKIKVCMPLLVKL
jgi:hypothetical protein